MCVPFLLYFFSNQVSGKITEKFGTLNISVRHSSVTRQTITIIIYARRLPNGVTKWRINFIRPADMRMKKHDIGVLIFYVCIVFTDCTDVGTYFMVLNFL